MPAKATRKPTPKRNLVADALEQIAPARNGDMKAAVGRLFGALARLQESGGGRKADEAPCGEWVKPDWDQGKFEAACHSMMQPAAADKLIRSVAAARSSDQFAARERVAARHEAEKAERAAADRTHRALDLRAVSGLPPEFYAATFGTRPDGGPVIVSEGNRRAFGLCVRLADEWQLQHKGLTLSSPDSGCGKSLLCAAVAQQLIETHLLRVSWVTVSGLLDLYRQSYGATWEKNPGVLSTEQVWQTYAVRPGLLILDDIGAERAASDERGEWAREKLLDLINHRFEGKKTILATTNLDEAGLRTRYGARIVSRLLGRSPLITMTGPDYRQDVLPDADDPFQDD